MHKGLNYKALILLNFLILGIASALFLTDKSNIQGRFTAGSIFTPKTYYASPTGTGGGRTSSRPSTLENLLTSSYLKKNDTILLQSGTYTPSRPYPITKNLTIIGSNGIGFTGTSSFDCSTPTECFKISPNTSLNLSHVELINYETGILAQQNASLTLTSSTLSSSLYRGPFSSIIGVLAEDNSQITITESALADGNIHKSTGVRTEENTTLSITNSNAFDLYRAIQAEEAKEIIIDNNTFEQSHIGVDSIFSDKLHITNNFFDTTDQASEIEGNGDIFIDNNEVLNGTAGLLLIGAGTAQISNNLFDSILVPIVSESETTDSSGALHLSKFEISDNIFQNGSDAITIFSSNTGNNSSSSIHENEFTNNSSGIIVAGPDGTHIYRNHFDTHNQAITLGTYPTPGYEPLNLVENNLIENSLVGMNIINGKAKIIYNTIVNNADFGISLDGDQSELHNNIIDSCGFAGFYIYNASTSQLGHNNVNRCLNDYYGTYTDRGNNTIQNPGFMSATNYALNPSSLLIDAAGILFTTEDYTGKTRTTPDIGAYEF